MFCGSKLMCWPPTLDVPHAYTYIDDFGRALAILGERGDALSQAWITPNPETVMQRLCPPTTPNLFGSFRDKLGYRKRTESLPGFPLAQRLCASEPNV
jgi:hypothetical protein